MGNIAFLIAFIVMPIIALWRLKAVTWTLVVSFLSVGFVGAFVQVSAAFGTRWTTVGLQWALTAAMLVVFVVAACSTPRGSAFQRLIQRDEDSLFQGSTQDFKLRR